MSTTAIPTRNLRPSRSIHKIANDEDSDVEENGAGPSSSGYTVFAYCGVTTHAGVPCRRPVTRRGDRCRYHKDADPTNVRMEDIDPQNKHSTATVNGKRAKHHGQDDSDFEIPGERIIATPSSRKKTRKSKETEENDDSVECLYCDQLLAPPPVDWTPPISKELTPIPVSRQDRVRCSQCRRRCHLACSSIFTAQTASLVQSYPWYCNECKVCAVCRDTGDESTLLICDGCDRAWHGGCVNPKIEELPTGKWLCGLCRRCHSCEAKALLGRYREIQLSRKRFVAKDVSKEEVELADEDVQPAPSSRLSLNSESYHHPTVISQEIILARYNLGQTSDEEDQNEAMKKKKDKKDVFMDRPRELHLCTYCPECETDFTANRYCPCCLVTYPEKSNGNVKNVDDGVEGVDYTGLFDEGVRPNGRRRIWWYHSDNMICCDKCDRWIHPGCDPDMTQAKYDSLTKNDQAWVCPLCRIDAKPQYQEQWRGLRIRAGVRVRELGWISKPITEDKMVDEDILKQVRISCVGQRGEGAAWFSSTYDKRS